jgi:site-specific DNA-adenine methylase
MRSFIGWVGGKNQLKKYIIPLIPYTCDRYKAYLQSD